jgi:MoaA/NifB/PqqE/SkfB family radical SAM enzyme
MANYQTLLTRGRQESGKELDLILARELGPRYTAYRRKFREAESGHRPDYPLHLDLDVTTVCQLGCPMCPAGSKTKKEGGLAPDENSFPGFGLFMDQNLFLEAMRQAGELGVPSVRFGMTGEPLLIDDLDLWVAEAAQSCGFTDLAMISNGQLLDSRTSEKLIKAGLTKLMISVDAATAETYELVRPFGDFERLIDNIESFLRIRKELGRVLPLLRLSFVVMAWNLDEEDLFREKFSSLADYLTFQDYLNIMGRKDTDLRVGTPKVPLKAYESPCSDPLTRMAVHADGGLFPCCADFGRINPVGTLWHDGLKNAWTSERAVRLASPGGRKSIECQKCLIASGMREIPAKEAEGDGKTAAGSRKKITDRRFGGPRPRPLSDLEPVTDRPVHRAGIIDKKPRVIWPVS